MTPKVWTSEDLRTLRTELSAKRSVGAVAAVLDRPVDELAEMARDLREWIGSPPLAPK